MGASPLPTGGGTAKPPPCRPSVRSSPLLSDGDCTWCYPMENCAREKTSRVWVIRSYRGTMNAKI